MLMGRGAGRCLLMGRFEGRGAGRDVERKGICDS